jgi:hypothetical protein
MQGDLGVRKLLLRQRTWDAIAALAQGGGGGPGAAPEAEPSLAELQRGFAQERPTWFDPSGSSGGGQRGRSPDSGSNSDSAADSEGRRNWRPVDDSKPHDWAAKAGRREKEALRRLGFNLLLDGREIGTDFHGILPNGFLTREALACLGLAEWEGYDALWGCDGRAATAAAGRSAEEVLAAAAELRGAVALRHVDEDRRCKLRQAVRRCALRARLCSAGASKAVQAMCSVQDM